MLHVAAEFVNRIRDGRGTLGIGAGSWLTLPATVEYVFWDRPQDLWDVVVKEAGGWKLSDILGLRVVPLDPSWN